MLLGGRARRMGGAAKHLLEVGGSTPWARTLSALAANGVAPVVAVGPAVDAAGGAAYADAPPVAWVREDPPFSGPVAAIAAALSCPALDGAEEVLLLAGDLARPEGVVARLAGPDPAGADGAPADAVVFRADGQPQWLAGRYRVAAVREALAALGAAEGASCRALLGGLGIRWIPDEEGTTSDIDTPDDLARARAEAAGSAAGPPAARASSAARTAARTEETS